MQISFGNLHCNDLIIVDMGAKIAAIGLIEPSGPNQAASGP